MVNLDYRTLILLTLSWASFIGLLLILRWFIQSREATRQDERVSQFINRQAEARAKQSAQKNQQQVTSDVDKYRGWLNRALRSLSSPKLQMKLSSAYWAITDIEFILVRFSATAITFLLGWFTFNNVLGGIFIGVIIYLIPHILLDRAIAKRQKDFHDQLLDVLILVKGAVQAGYGLLQALSVAVDESPPPASEEFSRVLQEIRLGFSLEEAFTNLSKRMKNDDLQIVVTAIIINAQVGGNLSTVLEAAVSTIRDRMQLNSEIQSLTSYARYVGNFLTLLPFAAGLAIFIINPGYFETIKTSLLVQILFGLALVAVFIGNILLRRIMKIKV